MSTKTHKRQTALQILKTAKSQKMLAGNWEVVATLELSAEDAELLETLELTCDREMEGHHYDN